jgi:hypothetical protein
VVNVEDKIKLLKQYFLKVKPFHTKVLGVSTNYIHKEVCRGTITERIQFNLQFNVSDTVDNRFVENFVLNGEKIVHQNQHQQTVIPNQWDRYVDGFDIYKFEPNTVLVSGNVVDFFQGKTSFEITGSIANDGTYPLTGLTYLPQNDATAIQTTSTLDTNYFGGKVVGGSWDLFPWDGDPFTNVPSPDSDLTIKMRINECFQVFRGTTYDDPMENGWDSDGWDEGIAIYSQSVQRNDCFGIYEPWDSMNWDLNPYDNLQPVDTENRVLVYNPYELPNPNPLPYLYLHEQTTPSTTWIVVHKLGYNPVVDVFVNGVQITPQQIIYDSPDQLTIVLNTPEVGFAQLR